MKKLFIKSSIVFILSLICFGGVYFGYKNFNVKLEDKSKENTQEEQINNIQEENKEKVKSEVNTTNSIETSNEDNNKNIEEVTPNEVTTTNTTNTTKPKENIQPQPKENKTTTTSTNTQAVTNEKKNTTNATSSTPQPNPAPTHTPTEWEKLGMTEEEYNNTPKWNWAKGENYFSAKQYGSLENAFNSCVTAGNEKKNANGGGGFACPDVLGLNDKVIGYYLDYFELKE